MSLSEIISVTGIATEIIGVPGAETRDGLACLSPRSCVLGVGVADATDFRKSLIKNDVSRQIRGTGEDVLR
jgi:hypothetical protein